MLGTDTGGGSSDSTRRSAAASSAARISAVGGFTDCAVTSAASDAPGGRGVSSHARSSSASIFRRASRFSSSISGATLTSRIDFHDDKKQKGRPVTRSPLLAFAFREGAS